MRLFFLISLKTLLFSGFTLAQDLYGRYEAILEYYDIDEKRVKISREIILDLNRDNTYSYVIQDLFHQATDTGTFQIQDDTIRFQSKYPEEQMHYEYYLTVRNGFYYGQLWESELNSIDTSQWFYLKVFTRTDLNLPLGFRLSMQGYDFICDDSEERIYYKACISKRNFSINDSTVVKVYFPDLNLIMNASLQMKGRAFNNALILGLQIDDDEDIPLDAFIVPKTLRDAKLWVSEEGLFFIQRNGTLYTDDPLKRLFEF